MVAGLGRHRRRAFTLAGMDQKIVFIGGGNMASALIGGLVRDGWPAANIVVIEPVEAQRAKLGHAFGVDAQAAADERLAGAPTAVWAVKPQIFAEAAVPCAAFVRQALQVSVMAGVRSLAIGAAVGNPGRLRWCARCPTRRR
jgi:pyrroline-5-carboxylate reductase